MSSLVFYTARDVADALGVPVKTVRRRFASADWPAQKIGSQWCVTGERLEEIKRLYDIENMPVTEGTMEMLKKTLLDRLASYEENVQAKKKAIVEVVKEYLTEILSNVEDEFYGDASDSAEDLILNLHALYMYKDQFELIRMLKTEIPLIVNHYARKGGETDGNVEHSH